MQWADVVTTQFTVCCRICWLSLSSVVYSRATSMATQKINRNLCNALRGFMAAALLAAAGCGSEAPKVSPAPTDHVFYELEIEGRTVVLDLRPNDTVVARDYREYMAMPGGFEE